jgi:alpha/beta superfamily hydrolase
MTQGGNAKSEQIMLPGADHYFVDHPDEMTAAISNWLRTVTN